jgi:hypothetical protein
MGREHLGKRRLGMKNAHHFGFCYAHDRSLAHRRCRRQAQQLSAQATLAEESAVFEYCDNGFLPLVGRNRNLDLPRRM